MNLKTIRSKTFIKIILSDYIDSFFKNEIELEKIGTLDYNIARLITYSRLQGKRWPMSVRTPNRSLQYSIHHYNCYRWRKGEINTYARCSN